jgi:lysozyme family protein
MSYTDIFSRCIEVILKNEGGLVDNPYDPGGLTNFGICQRNYPELDIKNLTRNEAIQIYFRDYWSPMNLHNIEDELSILHIFDMGVNAGIRIGIKIAQRIVGAEVDGFIGPESESKINAFVSFTDTYKQERRKYYFMLARRKPELEIFLAGWLNRVDRCHFELVDP